MTNPKKQRGIQSKKMKPWKKVLFALGTCILLLFIGFLGYAYSLLNRINHENIASDDASLSIEATDLSQYYNQVDGISQMVLFGVDTLGSKGRSDAIILLTLDENKDKLKLTSLARDAYVVIPGRGLDKLTHAYSFGGPQLAIQTINENFGLNIRYYASANFTTLPKIIQALGGVSLYITEKESVEVPDTFGAGSYLLDGEQALAFARIRSIDSDVYRNQRQRKVLSALFTKLLKQPLTAYPNLLGKIFPMLATNMSSAELLSFAGKVAASGAVLEESRYPEAEFAIGEKIDGVYYTTFDLASAKDRIGRYLYLDLLPDSLSQ